MNAPRRYVRPCPPEELARIMGELDEAEAVRGDELLTTRKQALQELVAGFAVMAAVFAGGWFLWQLVLR